MIDPRQVQAADAPQLKLSKNELSRLMNRIDADVLNAIGDHEGRMRRFQSYYQRWRNRTEIPEAGEEETSNFRVPLTQWQVASKWAKEHSSLFGSDAEITAKPVGPDDQRRVRKVARFMTWRVFNSMKLVNRAAVFNFRKILFGRAHAYCPWVRDTFDVPGRDGSMIEAVHYDGPGFDPLWPDDLIVPAEDVANLQQFSFVVRKFRATPDDLLRGEDAGVYQQVRTNFEHILNFSNDRKRRDWTERVKREKDLAEGVIYEGGLSAANAVQVWEWYGRWRRLKGRGDGAENNLDRRDPYESELVIRYLPDLHLIIGVQDLAEMYPLTKNRRPIVEAALMQDGSYWGPGFGELLEDLESELSINHNLATQGGQFAVGPVIFYKPASGFNPDTFEYRPMSCVASEDPTGIRVVELKADMQPTIVRNQELVTYGERVTGITDMNIGRTQDRPNAPRTARQTMALLEEGDVRAGLDTSSLREHWGDILTHFWQLEQMYGSPSTFFRVTEEDAGGLFQTGRGGSWLDEADKTGTYDFDLKFATNAFSKEQHKQDQLSLYQIDLQNPLVVNNPRALWVVLDGIHRAFGDDRFSHIVPEPPDLGEPLKPVDEWTRALEHEPLDVHPMDNDQQHITDHQQRTVDEEQSPHPDQKAIQAMEFHIQEHVRSMQQKKLMAELTSRLASSLRDSSGGLFQQAQPTSLQNLQAHLQGLTEPQEQKQQPKKAA